MGMFDRLILECSNCKEKLEFQSKGGECVLEEYNRENVPWGVDMMLG